MYFKYENIVKEIYVRIVELLFIEELRLLR